MNRRLENILDLEEQEKFEEAFHEYESLDLKEFDNWKHYYFFLWYLIVEDYPLGVAELVKERNFLEKINTISDYGFEYYEDLPEFQFIVGYTMGVMAFLFGDDIERENEGKDLLKKAYNENPENLVYEIAYNGSLAQPPNNYKERCLLAQETVKSQFSGTGLLNRYFGSVLNRK